MRRFLLVLALLAAASGAAGWWYVNRPPELVGIALGNGRLEAEEIDIAAEIAGRIVEIRADEGDFVEAGQVLVTLDAQQFEAGLRRAQAQLARMGAARQESEAELEQREAERAFADQSLKRAMALLDRGHASRALVDQRISERDAAVAGCVAAEAKMAEMDQAIAMADAELAEAAAKLDDTVLRAPRAGRVQFRLREPGEVVPAGGKVLTLIDLDDMYMTFFLPTLDAGRVPLGAEARIVLDAFPEQPVAARISFVADQAQFTPKQVETQTERQKLVFRVKAQVIDTTDPRLKPGMPGVAYIRYDDSVAWPDHLK